MRHAILEVDTWPALLLAIHRLHSKVLEESKKRGQIVNESNFASDSEMVLCDAAKKVLTHFHMKLGWDHLGLNFVGQRLS